VTLAAKVNFWRVGRDRTTPSGWLANGGPECHYLGMPLRLRNDWTYSIGVVVDRGIELALVSAARRDRLSYREERP
jgi:hypothetical protein